MITLFDTSIASENVGDFIIMDAVNEQLAEVIYTEQIITLPTHDTFGKEGRRILSLSKYAIVGGTNLLTSQYFKYQQWKFRARNLTVLNNSVLMGVGWWQYQTKPDLITSKILKRILSSEFIHSVRDEYTKKQLAKIGIYNVINTSCPTMWKLTPEHCKNITKTKAKSVVFTLTDYNKNEVADLHLIETLVQNYQDIYYWPQGTGDLAYIDRLVNKIKCNINILPPNLTALNNTLKTESIDYIGTRLHAGVRALQLSKRTIIIGIDNRALEKSKDFNLTVLSRDEISKLDSLINSTFETVINLPIDNINKWKKQFNG